MIQKRYKKRRINPRRRKEKATHNTEWLFTGLKSVRQHIFEQVANFFWPLLLQSVYSQFLELVHKYVV